MSKLNLYSIFHLNLAYSSLPEERAGEVIERCYRPLLQLAEDFDVKIGIEAPAYTLEKIQEIEPVLIEKLKELIRKGKCEFVGSGYMQIIGPIVPAEVNRQNLKIGNDVYQTILGIKPRIAYVNEQAYSQSLITHYLEAGFEAIIMEWNNPAKFHPEWKEEFQYQPQIAVDNNKNSIKVIWNNSVAFQKFQRYATGEIELAEYLDYLKSHASELQHFFPMYSSDAEVFDFRTMRYREEVPIIESGEWQRIGELFASLSANEFFSFVFPSEVIAKASGENAFNKIHLESGDQPIPVKKRETYNITRWALTGRDNIGINTKCYKIYNNLLQYAGTIVDEEKLGKLWKELCYLWASDFRTHITEERFVKYGAFLEKMLAETGGLISKNQSGLAGDLSEIEVEKKDFVPIVEKEGRNIIVETKFVKIKLNTLKGLAIESLVFKNISPEFLVGFLDNNYYNNISFAEDFFSGHTTIEIPMQQKVTDLELVEVKLPEVLTDTESVCLEANVKVGSGTIHKIIKIFNYENRIDVKYIFKLNDTHPSAFRTGVLTYNPKAFRKDSLYYACSNGGQNQEVFSLNSNFKSGHLLSHLVSSGSVLGNTKGRLEIGDEDKSIILLNDLSELAALPMIHFEKVAENSYFLRTFYSLGEFDETSLVSKDKKEREVEFSLAIIGKSNK